LLAKKEREKVEGKKKEGKSGEEKSSKRKRSKYVERATSHFLLCTRESVP
jgi:hypothetical protein